MNANQNTDERLKRIQDVSRIARFAILTLLVISIGGYLWIFFRLPPNWVEQMPLQVGLGFLMQWVWWVWYWKLAKLFQFYQRGLIFAHETIRCFRVLGFLCVINALVTSIWGGACFFSISFGGINVGMLLAGTVIVLVAWIMDEGRKIQEEQELTV